MAGSGALVLTVAAVGILHTIVPDHWGPIVVVARQRGWSVAQTARAAAMAGVGHVTTTLLLGAIVWYAGTLAAAQYAREVTLVSALALIAFGVWIAYGGWREARGHDHHDHAHAGHGHLHRHSDGTEHVHWHEHHDSDWHESGDVAVFHEHSHAATGRTALLLILGSSPMVEGIPAFLAASTYHPRLLVTMAVIFAAATILTYVALSVTGLRGVQRRGLGTLEQYGEMLSGLVVAAVGIYQLLGG
jgi:putative Mn2+ efflux pump MntP